MTVAKNGVVRVQSSPWCHPTSWKELVDSVVRTSVSTFDTDVRQQVLHIVKEIDDLYHALDEPLQVLSGVSCSSCSDVCCKKATVWYDLKDLLFLYIAKGTIPEEQVKRDGQGNCCWLGESGCILPRYRRPFICTWYLCASQTTLLDARSDLVERKNIKERIGRLKEARKKLEMICLQVNDHQLL